MARMSKPECALFRTGTSYLPSSQPTDDALGLLELYSEGLGCCRPTGYQETRSTAASARAPATRSAAASALGYPCSAYFVNSEESEIPIRIGISKDGQTPAHALLAFTIGVRQMICWCARVTFRDWFQLTVKEG